MKKTIYLIPVIICFLLGSISTAAAKQGFYIGIGVPYSTIDGDFDGSSVVHSGPDGNWIDYLPEMDGAFGINVQGGFGISEHWAVEFNIIRSGHDWKWQAESDKADYYTFSMSGKYNFSVSQTKQTYILLGISHNELEINNGSTDLGTGQVDDGRLSGPGINIGAGIDQYLGRHICVTLGLMYRFINYNSVHGAGSGFLRAATIKGSGFTFLLGTAYHF